MNRNTSLHHSLPVCLRKIADEIQQSSPSRKSVRRSRSQFLSIVRNQSFGVRRVKADFNQLPQESLPAIYFTHKSGNPVIIQERLANDQFLVRFWDGRVSTTDTQKLKRSLSPNGFILIDKHSDCLSVPETLSNWKEFLVAEKQHIGLGIGASAVSVSIMVLFIYLLHHLFNQTFEGAEVTTPVLVAFGFLSSILCSLAFLQIRGYLSLLVHKKSSQLRAKQQAIPKPFPLRAALNPTTTREWIELCSVPFLLIAAGLIVSWSPLSIAAWSTFLGCSVIAVVFSFALPRLVELGFTANSHLRRESKTREPDLMQSDGRKPILHVSNIHLAHPNRLEEPLINGLSFNLYAGEKYGLIGAKAADTSVLLRVLTGEIKPDSGTVAPNKKTARVGWYSERAALIDGTLADNLSPNQSKQPTTQQIELALELSGLNQTELYRAGGLNGIIDEAENLIDSDTKTRLILARSLVNQPSLLIYDMPINKQSEIIVLEVLERLTESQPELTILLGAKRGNQLAHTESAMLLRNGEKVLAGSTGFILESFETEMRQNLSL